MIFGTTLSFIHHLHHISSQFPTNFTAQNAHRQKQKPCDIRGAIMAMYFPILNEELFGTPESSKSRVDIPIPYAVPVPMAISWVGSGQSVVLFRRSTVSQVGTFPTSSHRTPGDPKLWGERYETLQMVMVSSIRKPCVFLRGNPGWWNMMFYSNLDVIWYVQKRPWRGKCVDEMLYSDIGKIIQVQSRSSRWNLKVRAYGKNTIPFT